MLTRPNLDLEGTREVNSNSTVPVVVEGGGDQMEAVIGHALQRAWEAGAGPGDEALVIDIDSTICEVDGNAKHGAGFGYTHTLGYHPLLATRADTGEVLHARMRKGAANTHAAQSGSLMSSSLASAAPAPLAR